MHQVIYALCMRSEPVEEGYTTVDATSYSPSEGMADLAQHFSALGRYVAEEGSSPSAFLVPVFGTADVLQAVRTPFQRRLKLINLPSARCSIL